MANVVRIQNVTCEKATDKAIFVDIEGESYWIPQSQIDDESEVYDDKDNSRGELVITRWIAEQKGLD